MADIDEPIDAGRVTHLYLMHRTEDEDGSAIPDGYLLAADGAKGHTWTDPAGLTGTTLTIEDEGTPLTTAADTLNFVGAGVTASGSGSTKTITISGSTVAALDDLTDVVITTPANADRLRYNGSTWENSDLVWEPMIASDGTVMTDGLLNPMQSEVAY